MRCKVKRVVAARSADAMLSALEPSERALWATALCAGLRRGELIGLRREDIDLAAGVIHVRRGWDAVEGEVPPKSRQGLRKVPIATVLRDHLNQHLRSTGDGPLSGSPRWVSRTNDRARQRWEGRGLPVLTLHEARHAYASFGIAAGLNAKTLSTYMGHANIAITPPAPAAADSNTPFHGSWGLIITPATSPAATGVNTAARTIHATSDIPSLVSGFACGCLRYLPDAPCTIER